MRTGAYQMPQAPGLGVGLKAESLADFSYPDGRVWRERRT